jgi:PhnB protein
MPMTQNAKPLPESYPTLLSYLIVRRADEALAFYKQVFNAVEIMRFDAPDG